MTIQDKKVYLNKLCNLTFMHVCCDGSSFVRTIRLYITDKNSGVLEDKRLIACRVIGLVNPNKLKNKKKFRKMMF